MSQFKVLQAATTLSEVALLLGVKPGMLSFQLYKKPKLTLYSKFEIPKRLGGTREIWAPEKDLKLLQHRLVDLLQNCIDEINAAKPEHAKETDKHLGIAHGFKRKRSIMSNARAHKTRRYVFNVDLHDFFGSINFGRIRGFLIKDKNFSLSPKVATVLAQIACHENKLPQGSPCSPVISNLIGHTLDVHLVKLAASSGCTYTRYADDLTFSTNKQEFPPQVAVRALDLDHKWMAGKELTRLITKSGFSLNEKKTRMQYRDSRQEVTGLSVNLKINSRKDYRYLVRAMVDNLIRTGAFEHVQKIKDTNGSSTVVKTPGKSNELGGMLAFIDLVDQYNVAMYKGESPLLPACISRDKLHRQFLLFDRFYAAQLPVILCEGDTDNVYLSHAIHQLVAAYPNLANKDAAGNVKLNVRLHKYSNKVTSRILKLHGGTGDLGHFIAEYHKQLTTKFKAPAGQHPVIMVIDNDSGREAVGAAVKKITKVGIAGTEPFVHITGNLYVVLTPLTPPTKESYIEQCFDIATLATPHHGKHFSPSNKIDPAVHYGKVVFAHEVVRPNASKIDFNGFKPLLDRVQAVIEDHAKKVHVAGANATA